MCLDEIRYSLFEKQDFNGLLKIICIQKHFIFVVHQLEGVTIFILLSFYLDVEGFQQPAGALRAQTYLDLEVFQQPA